MRRPFKTCRYWDQTTDVTKGEEKKHEKIVLRRAGSPHLKMRLLWYCIFDFKVYRFYFNNIVLVFRGRVGNYTIRDSRSEATRLSLPNTPVWPWSQVSPHAYLYLIPPCGHDLRWVHRHICTIYPCVAMISVESTRISVPNAPVWPWLFHVHICT